MLYLICNYSIYVLIVLQFPLQQYISVKIIIFYLNTSTNIGFFFTFIFWRARGSLEKEDILG